MAFSPQIFPPRKRRPSAGAFITPKFSDRMLLQSLLLLSQEISSFSSKPLHHRNSSGLFKRNSLSIIRKTDILSILFQELLVVESPSRREDQDSPTSTSALLCFQEMYVVLQRIKTLLEDISHGSRMWLLFQNDSVCSSFRQLTSQLSTLFDIFPDREFALSDDVLELVRFVRRQYSTVKAVIDPRDDRLRLEVLTLLEGIQKEIAPEHSLLERIFDNLGLRDSASCMEEIEALEEEVQIQNSEKSMSNVVALIGLVRYSKCVLFGASIYPGKMLKAASISEVNVPTDFRCPISLELMRDPVVVATGQTYDREWISSWIQSGHSTCPKTGQTLAHDDLIPNRALKNLIAMWCREQRIPFDTAGEGGSYNKINGAALNKAAVEATRMTVSFLVNKLSVFQSMESANGVVYELRTLAKTNSDSRECMGEIGAIPLLVRYLGPDVGLEMPSLQVDAITTILNLSILDMNKARIVETDGALNGVIEMLRSGATWEAKGNAAAAIFSLSGIHSYKKRLGRKTRVVKGLLDLAKSAGPKSTKRDALFAILNLAGDRETVGRLLEGGVIDAVNEAMSVLPEEAVAVLEAVVKRGGLVGIAAAYDSIRKLGALLREGSDTTRESAAATLVTICRKGGAEMVEEIAKIPRIERSIWELMGTGTSRAKRKAANLSRILRRWSAGLNCEFVPVDHIQGDTVTATTLTNSGPGAAVAAATTSSSRSMLAS